MEHTHFSGFYRDWLYDNPLIASELWRRAFESGICSEQSGDADAAVLCRLVREGTLHASELHCLTCECHRVATRVLKQACFTDCPEER